MKKYLNKGFTLIELLIVIGIIALLAVTVLLTLNPAEAQKRTRDTKRIADAQKLQAILEQYINDGGDPGPTWEEAVTADGESGTTSMSAENAQSQGCAEADNWLGVDVCAYSTSVPTDPSNTQSRTCVDAGQENGLAEDSCVMFYYLRTDGSEYEIGVRQEAAANASKVSGDGGDSDLFFEVFTAADIQANPQ